MLCRASSCRLKVFLKPITKGEILVYLLRFIKMGEASFFRVSELASPDAAVNRFFVRQCGEVRDTLKRLGATMPEDLPRRSLFVGSLNDSAAPGRKSRDNSKRTRIPYSSASFVRIASPKSSPGLCSN